MAATGESGKRAKRNGLTQRRLARMNKLRKVHVSVDGRLVYNDRPLKVLRDVNRRIATIAEFTEDYRTDLLEIVAGGETIAGACAMLNVDYSVVRAHLRKDPNFLQAMQFARSDGAEGRVFEADKHLRRVMNGKATFAQIAAVSNYATHARWIAGKLNQEHYGDCMVLDATVLTNDQRSSLRDKILADAKPQKEKEDSGGTAG